MDSSSHGTITFFKMTISSVAQGKIVVQALAYPVHSGTSTGTRPPSRLSRSLFLAQKTNILYTSMSKSGLFGRMIKARKKVKDERLER